MANSILSPTIITREALRVLHANLNFIGAINRQYDNQFANGGASPSGKIGPTLTIRLPNEFTVRSGATLAVQDVTEASTTLTVSTQKGVDLNFSAVDLTLSIDEYSARYLKPAMARLASEIEADALSMYKDVYNFVDDDGNVISFLDYMKAGQFLDESLAPDDGERTALLSLTHNTKLTDALKGLFNPQKQHSNAFRKGKVAEETAGFADWYRNSLFTNHLTGTAAKTTGYTTSGASQSGASITVTGGTTTFLKGDLVTFAGCNAVHPETKKDLGRLKQFVLTADSGASAVSLAISPSIVLTGAKQNVTAAPTDTGAVVKLGTGVSGSLVQSLCFHPDAFTFVTADLIDVSKFGAWGARQTMDGISMRIARQYDIVNDKIPARIDVLYGFKTIRPQLACRIHANG
ncbi:MAG: Phage major capsid protein [Candidatus Sulfotelmatobacter sp.]|nr:Phage major capsid protein [Candidatus Sulfotelmatobacter sp.]